MSPKPEFSDIGNTSCQKEANKRMFKGTLNFIFLNKGKVNFHRWSLQKDRRKIKKKNSCLFHAMKVAVHRVYLAR